MGDYWLDRSFCGQNLVTYWKEDIVAFNSITDMSLLILHNPVHTAVLKQLGIITSGGEKELQQQTLRFGYQILFANTPAFMKQIDDWRPQFKKHRIGMQIRFAGSVAESKEDTQYLEASDISAFTKGVRKYCRDHGINMTDVTIHVSTDSEFVWTTLKELFPDNLFRPPNHFIAHTSFVENERKKLAYHSALVDIALLRECEYLIVTKGSSFGWTMAWQMKKFKCAQAAKGMGVLGMLPITLKSLIP